MDVGKAIEKAKRELEHMIDLHPGGMLLMDRAGRVTRANKALLEMAGAGGFAAVLGKRLDEVFPGCGILDPAEFGLAGSRVREAMVRFADGRELEGRFNVIGSGETSDVFVVVIDDIGADRALAAELEHRHKKEAVSALGGALMHHINQSLTVIMVRAHLMRMLTESAAGDRGKMRESLDDIVKETGRVAEILRKVESPEQFATESYPGGQRILDIGRLGREEAGLYPAGKTLSWRESSCNAVVDALLDALAAHEPNALAHSRDSALCAAGLARCMGLDAAGEKRVANCGRLHDIGKLAVPDEILGKPEPLSGPEMKIMRGHAEAGHAILGQMAFLRDEAESARWHHERCDGTGYPDGLKLAEIPVFTRIVSVADVFATLTGDRPYKRKVPAAKAMDEIERGSGSQFDPDVVRALQACLRDGSINGA